MAPILLSQSAMRSYFHVFPGRQVLIGRWLALNVIFVVCYLGAHSSKASPLGTIVARQSITLLATSPTNSGYFDSYDSSDPYKSSNGVYNFSIYSGDFGDISVLGGSANGASVSITNTLIYGKVHTGVGCPINLGPNGGVGTHTWLAVNSGIEPGYALEDARFIFPDTSLPRPPYAPNPLPGLEVIVTTNGTNVIYTTNTYTCILLPGHKYKFTTLPPSATVFVQASSPPTNAILLLTGGLVGSENFTIDRGARLAIYCDKSITVNGGEIANPNGNADSFVVYGTSNATSLRFAGNGTFTGMFIAPSADAQLYGGGYETNDFCGALLVNSLTTYSNFNFHFDEHLLTSFALPGPAAAKLTPQLPAGNQFQFNVSGSDGFPYVVEQSTNLSDWAPVTTNTAPFLFTPDTSSQPFNFYRAVYRP
jgi:hypothetical protein